ncbi:toxin-antitoxin system YwqK family antitoxin [Parasediminibacterium sp. JCM 36343]|uniref:toxin-antitoxin system YwqK family antitoxin n=1 Tax=Parasediminibacterium sp. JCM 36343 TaxID=3374279 RepID=UPI003979FCCF
MAQKVLSPNKWLMVAATICFIMCSCNHSSNQNKESVIAKSYLVDTSVIPRDTVFVTDKNVSRVNGLYQYKNNPFSGIIKELYDNGKVKKQLSVYQGMLHGTYRSYYEDGKPWEIRSYKNNLSTGKHYGFWAVSGNRHFEYNYYEEKMEGLQKKWYKSGKPLLFLNYVDDREEGLQQGWRENGKLYLNYVAKDGYRYGLQKSALCYTLRNEKIKSETE